MTGLPSSSTTSIVTDSDADKCSISSGPNEQAATIDTQIAAMTTRRACTTVSSPRELSRARRGTELGQDQAIDVRFEHPYPFGVVRIDERLVEIGPHGPHEGPPQPGRFGTGRGQTLVPPRLMPRHVDTIGPPTRQLAQADAVDADDSQRGGGGEWEAGELFTALRRPHPLGQIEHLFHSRVTVIE